MCVCMCAYDTILLYILFLFLSIINELAAQLLFMYILRETVFVSIYFYYCHYFCTIFSF